MTAPAPLDLTALLDDLERAHAAIGDSPAFRVVGYVQDDENPEWVLARFADEGTSVFAECYGTDAAALIVAAVNALPQLVAAVRGVLALAGELEANFEHGDSVHRLARNMCSRRLRATLTAALSPESVKS